MLDAICAMSKGQTFVLEKISKINYRIATHEGCANERLASQASKLFVIPTELIPPNYREGFSELIERMERTVQDLPGLMVPVRVKGIYNKTAVKYIKLLIEIEDFLTDSNGHH